MEVIKKINSVKKTSQSNFENHSLFVGLEDNRARFTKALDTLTQNNENPHMLDLKKSTVVGGGKGNIEKIKNDIRDQSPTDHLHRMLVMFVIKLCYFSGFLKLT